MNRLVKIKYIRDLELPRARSGKTGDVKEVERVIARALVRNGFAVYEVTTQFAVDLNLPGDAPLPAITISNPLSRTPWK